MYVDSLFYAWIFDFNMVDNKMKIRAQNRLVNIGKILLVLGLGWLGYNLGGFIGLFIFAGLTLWWSFTR